VRTNLIKVGSLKIRDLTNLPICLAAAAPGALCALTASGDFDDYRAHHSGQEHQRTHQARYRDNLSLAA
jgi:hypothetical protein